jgi:hypothetical protein
MIDTTKALAPRIAEFSQWCALTHFTTIIHITFSNGNKRQDLVKVCTYMPIDVEFSWLIITKQAFYVVLSV